MLSRDLRQILPPKCHFSFVKKCKFRQKCCHKSEFRQFRTNFVKHEYFRHNGQFSSFRQFFVKNEILWSLLTRQPSHASHAVLLTYLQ